MEKFNFSKLADLNLSPLEMLAIHNIFDKQQINFDFWKLNAQEFVEIFIRSLKSSVSLNAVPSVVCAQAIDESGWFKTRSLFGIKATEKQIQDGLGTEEATHEIEEGKSVSETDQFLEINSVPASFGNYFEYLSRRKPGTKKFVPGDAVGYLNALQSPTFAFDNDAPTGAYSSAGEAYIDEILSIIKSNGFQAFDHI